MEFDDLLNKAKAMKAPEMEISAASQQATGVENLLSDLQKQERKRQRKNTIGAVCLALSLPVVIWSNIAFGLSLYTGIGFGIVYLAFVFAFFFMFQDRFAVKDEEWNEATIPFLQKVATKIKRRKRLLPYFSVIYVVLLATGINIVYVDVLSTLSWEWKLGIFTTLNLFMLGIGIGGWWREWRKFKQHYLPSLLQIEDILSDWNKDEM